MSDPTIKRATPKNILTEFTSSGSPAPKMEDIFVLPTSFIACIREITPKIDKSGAWWALGGDLAEMLGGVTVVPKEIEILTTAEDVKKIFGCLAEYNPSQIELVEKKLDREAEIDGTKYPIVVRSHQTCLTVHGAAVVVYGDYQMKVGDWDWGDPLQFRAPHANVTGSRVPVMPIRLASEFYLTLGWSDRVELISAAIHRAHHALGQMGYDAGMAYEASG
jgi:hypothetical protein